MPEEIERIGTQSLRKSLHSLERDIALAPLDRADIGSVKTCKLRELLLGESATETGLAQIESKNRPKISLISGSHGGRMGWMQTKNLQTISFPFRHRTGS